jgi:sugar phosphate isomerase/epimerase
VHVHDNHGMRDEHLWPGEGNIDWPNTVDALKSLAPAPASVLEIQFAAPESYASITEKARLAFDCLA